MCHAKGDGFDDATALPLREERIGRVVDDVDLESWRPPRLLRDGGKDAPEDGGSQIVRADARLEESHGAARSRRRADPD